MSGADKQYFSDIANCYGYAVKCASPVNALEGGQAKPGGVTPLDSKLRYYNTLKDGVIRDGGSKVKFLSDYDVSSLSAANVPSVNSSEYYLIAMLVKADGFHFVRRQRKRAMGTPFWKWKQGNGGKVERNAYDLNGKSWVRVTDTRFPDLVKGALLTDAPGYDGWDRIYFFQVKTEGFKVNAS